MQSGSERLPRRRGNEDVASSFGVEIVAVRPHLRSSIRVHLGGLRLYPYYLLVYCILSSRE